MASPISLAACACQAAREAGAQVNTLPQQRSDGVPKLVLARGVCAKATLLLALPAPEVQYRLEQQLSHHRQPRHTHRPPPVAHTALPR